MSTSLHYRDDELRAILAATRTIAMIGASARPERPSHGVMRYLLAHGYDVIPVNPAYAGSSILNRRVQPDLASIGFVPDMVDIFRRSQEVGAVVDEALAAGVRTIWMQLGVRDDRAAARAMAAGCQVVMDRCPKIEHARLMGER